MVGRLCPPIVKGEKIFFDFAVTNRAFLRHIIKEPQKRVMNEEDFKAMVMPGCRAAYAWASRIVGVDNASDIVQESLRRLWERRRELSSMDNVTGYIMMIVRNMAVDLMKERENLVGFDTLSSAQLASKEAPALERSEDAKLLQKMLRMLPDSQREVVKMSLLAAMSNSEIAEVTGLSYELVRQNLSRGRKKLRELYKAATK